MRIKKSLLVSLMLIVILSIPVVAKPTSKGPIFMGEILEVTRDEQYNTIRLLVRGYIKGCEVYEEELIALVNENTVIIENKCVTGSDEGKKSYKNIEVSKGDRVFIILSDAMTKSIPPQSVARAIQVSKAPQ